MIPAWTYRTGDLGDRAPDVLKRSKFEAPPILTGDKLIACTPFKAVVALDPGSGRGLWRYDPEIKTDYRPANMFAPRGVAVRQHLPRRGPGRRRAHSDRDRRSRLIALDLKDGKPCRGFGQDGAVRIDPGEPLLWPGEFQFTSPPAVIGDLVILGSSIGDNQRVDAPRGTVRAFDVEPGRAGTGTRCQDAPMTRTHRAGAMAGGLPKPPMSRRSRSSRRRGLVFLPTTSPSPDCGGGFLERQSPRRFRGRPQGRDRYVMSVGHQARCTTISGITTSRPSRASPRSHSTARSAMSSSGHESKG